MMKVLIFTLLLSIGIYAQSLYLNSAEPSFTTIDGKTFYQISRCTELAWFRDRVNAGNTDINAVLTKNINCYTSSKLDISNASNWIPIGQDSLKSYRGVFNGNHYKISNIYIDTTEASYVYGLFGYVSGEISNLKINNFYFNIPKSKNQSAKGIGGFVAKAERGAYLNNLQPDTILFSDSMYIKAVFDNFKLSYSSVEFPNFGWIVGIADSSTIDNILVDTLFIDSVGRTNPNQYQNGLFSLVGTLKNSVMRNCLLTQERGILFRQGENSLIENSSSYGIHKDSSMVYNNISYSIPCREYGKGTDESYKDYYGWATTSGCEYQQGYHDDSQTVIKNGTVKQPYFYKDSILGIAFPFAYAHEDFLNEWVYRNPNYKLYKTWKLYKNWKPSNAPRILLSDSLPSRQSWIAQKKYDISWYNMSSDEFTITNIEQLAGLSAIVNGYQSGFHDTFKGKKITLNSDIKPEDASRYIWVPIGNKSFSFEGEFDGKNHRIEGLFFDSLSSIASLFGFTAGKIKHLKIGQGIYAGSWVSGISFYNSGLIDSCSIESDLSTKSYGVAGLAIYNAGTISNSSYNGVITKNSNPLTQTFYGGIAIYNAGIVENNTIWGEIKIGGEFSPEYTDRYYYTNPNWDSDSIPDYVCGGIAAYNLTTGKIQNVRNFARIDTMATLPTSVVGGIVGINQGVVSKALNGSDTIYLRLLGKKLNYVGGIVGRNEEGGVVDRSSNMSPILLLLDYSYTSKNSSHSGGIVAFNNGKVTNSFNKGNLNVEGKHLNGEYMRCKFHISGLVASGSGSVNNSYNTGIAYVGLVADPGTAYIHIFGNNSISNSYNYGTASYHPLTRLISINFGSNYIYNSYAISSYRNDTTDITTLSDSYYFDSLAASGGSTMKYYNLDSDEEANGSLLEALNQWVQFSNENFGTDYARWNQGREYPEFDESWVEEITSSSSKMSSSSSYTYEISSSSIASSSSKEINSSSDVEASSSERSSSSTEIHSSSDVESSSSERSSSSKEINSSSSEKSNFVMATPQKTFNLSVNGMTVTLSNTQGGSVRVFDVLGHLVTTKPLSVTGITSVTLQTPGNYIIRVNGVSKALNLK